MTAFDEARVCVFVADYAAVDAGGKINAIGAAFTQTGLQPPDGLTSPMHVVALVETPRRLVGQSFSLAVELRRDDPDQVVSITGSGGGSEAVRVAQVVTPALPGVPAGARLTDSMYSRSQVLFGFPNGLRLQAGVSYRWRVEIDGQHRPEWEAVFEVLAPAPSPVFGGPTTPVGPELPHL